MTLQKLLQNVWIRDLGINTVSLVKMDEKNWSSNVINSRGQSQD